ncbi:MAG: type VI secretion system baseplate subunit TssF [Chitinivibrionales bacterium]|nr:type VI secretion system baseplate subunit TssF [Chitinivibrionales bacterium]
MIEKFFEEELRYLYESGKEFAKAHPDRAQLLNIDSVGDRDPYVERLFEGFAFLTARIREKLDDTFPQLTEGIINLLWPQLLQEIPSLTIIHLLPRIGLLQESKKLPRGSEVLSNPVGPASTVCRFITTQEVEVHPFNINSVEKQKDSQGRDVINFHFNFEPGVAWYNLKVQKLQFYLHAELPVAQVIHECLTTSVVRAQISINGGQHIVELDPETAITAGGCEANTSLLPSDHRSFWGYMLLREYFIYPEKFMFFHINGFDQIPRIEPAPQSITYTVHLAKNIPAEKPFSTDYFRLYCTPAVNLFLKESEPVMRTGFQTEYLIRPETNTADTVRIHSIQTVTGLSRVSGKRSEYSSLYTFKNINTPNPKTFTSRCEISPNGKRLMYLITNGNMLTEKNTLDDENLTVICWSTNGDIPRDEIREGFICKPGKEFPDFVRIANITRPTLPCLPPESSHYLWLFLSHLSATWSSFSSADTLKSFLKTYDWSRQEGRSRRIEAIQLVSSAPAECFLQGFPIRGVQLTVTIKESEFKDSGDIYLFGKVLSQFLSQFVSINSFMELIFNLKPSDQKITWNPLKGKRCLI